MRLRTTIGIFGLSVATMFGAMQVAAQQNALLTLRNGQVLTGDLVDMGAAYTFRINGENREIPRNDVSSVDFGGAAFGVPAAAKTLESGQALVVMRNGEMFTGEFYDVSGTSPLRLIFRTSSGERQLSSADVRLIYTARVDDGTVASTASAGATPSVEGGRTISVNSRSQWTTTGISVRQGQTVNVASSGEITFTPRGHRATPAGSVDQLSDTKAPIPSAPQGALIGRIGLGTTGRGATGIYFLIGNQTSVVMPGSGVLYLGVNDSGVGDNQGAFTVVVAPQ